MPVIDGEDFQTAVIYRPDRLEISPLLLNCSRQIGHNTHLKMTSCRHGRTCPRAADYGALSRNGLTMARPPMLRPCCMSSLNSVSQLPSIAAATINAS